MKLFMTPLLLSSFVLLHTCHGLTQHQVLANLLRDRSRVNSKNEWSAPYIIAKEQYDLYASQDGSQEKDRITALPGQPPNVKFAQYSGYVTVDKNAGRALFYYFAEAQDPSKMPLLLWLNGGPGCSSFGVGAMTELGPFRVASDNKTLYSNPYAWNRVANTLFLESPAGVGFSYSNRSSDYRNGSDANTARDSYTFLLNWFERFPQYKFRDFYIGGESYAGYYIPQLADTILSNNNSHTSFINLKGVMIGNGIMSQDTFYCGRADYSWSHALISDEDYESLRCKNKNNRTDIKDHTLAASQSHSIYDVYNIYAPLCPAHPSHIWPSSASTDTVMPTNGLSGFDPCSPGYVYYYLNRPEVQKVLHANVTSLPYEWTECSEVLSYDKQTTSVFPIYHRMIAAGLKILVYSGDVDGMVPVTSTRYGLKALKLEIETPWYPWMNSEIDLGGFSVVYKGGLTFATVRGAGHEVPSHQPSRAFTMIKFFLTGKPLPSPNN